MATIEVSKTDLEKIIGKKIDLATMNEDLFNVKLELDREEDDKLFIELEYDRADMLSTEGIARQLRGYYGIETGIKKYDPKPSGSRMTMDRELKKYRPYAQYFVALNVPFSDASIKQIMQVQEKLHFVYSNDRELASIGVYDYDKTSKNFTYTAEKPEKIKFTPLDSPKEMNGKQILKEHPKGINYAFLLEKLDRYPLLADDKGKVLSMPPIINSDDTRVDENTKNLFVDVSGLDDNVVKRMTAILATMLAERGADIRTVELDYDGVKTITPDLSERKMKLNPDYARRMLGMSLQNDEITRLLKKQRLDATLDQGSLIVSIPCYRQDIKHEIDLVEELSCAYGLNNMKPIMPDVATIGEVHKVEKKAKKARMAMTGLGFQEVATFMLSQKSTFERLDGENLIELKNPQTEEYNCLRNSLIPKALEFLQKNKHYDIPQRIFECGEIIVATNRGEQKSEMQKHITAAITDDKTDFTHIKSLCEALLKAMKIKAEYKPIEDKRFVKGRAAEIIEKEKRIGIIGEINPEILALFSLENPVAVFELNIEKLF